jgi:tol-pal system protein YbgF
VPFFANCVADLYDFGAVNPRHLAWLSLVFGCATPASAIRNDNKRLNETVVELREQRRAQARKLDDLEHQLDQLRSKAVSSVVDMPSLPVEVATPPATAVPDTGQRVVGIADDGGEIIYEGDAAAGKMAVPESDSSVAVSSGRRIHPSGPPPSIAPAPVANADVPTTSDRIEVTHRVPPVSARSPRSKVRADTPGERTQDAGAEYRAAVEMLKSGHHDEAIIALRAFIQHYPRHDYADNAQYWLGEAFYVQKDYPHALAEFRATIETYPRGNKVPDALLKVGYCYQALGQTEKARATLEQVVNLYPKSEPAVLAAKRLETP